MAGRELSRSTVVVVALVLAAGCGRGAVVDSTPPPEPSAPASHHEHREHAAFHHSFDNAEAWAKQFDDPARDAWQKPDAVIAMLGLTPDTRVADIGAGTGYFAVRLARAVPEGTVFAVDIEPDMVRYLGERAAEESLSNIVAISSTSSATGFTEPVDLAFVCNTYHHVDARTVYFQALAGQLTEGGRVVIVDFRPDAPDDAPGPPKQHRIPAEVVVQELTAAGLQHVQTDATTLPYQYIAVFRRP